MTDMNYSALLHQLVADYFDQRISRVEYLALRRSLLDRIDHEFNGELTTNGWPEPESSQPLDTTDTSVRTVVRDTLPDSDTV